MSQGKKAKKYCIAYGCLNTNKTPNISFFTLPRDPERRCQWLVAIDRQDLLNVQNMKPTTYLVCSAHFDISSLNISTYREPKKDAVPNLVCFPIQERYVEKYTQTHYTYDELNLAITEEIVEKRTIETQTGDDLVPKRTLKARKRMPSSPRINPLEPECSLVEGEIKLELEY